MTINSINSRLVKLEAAKGPSLDNLIRQAERTGQSLDVKSLTYEQLCEVIGIANPTRAELLEIVARA